MLRAFQAERFVVSPVQLPPDHVDRTEGRDHVGHHSPCEELGQGRHDGEAGRSDAYPVRVLRSVTYYVEPEFPVCAFHGKVPSSEEAGIKRVAEHVAKKRSSEVYISVDRLIKTAVAVASPDISRVWVGLRIETAFSTFV